MILEAGLEGMIVSQRVHEVANRAAAMSPTSSNRKPRAYAAGAKCAPEPFTGEEDLMNTIRLIAIALIVAGVLGLAYGGFSYTKDTTAVKLGPIELSVKEKQTVNVPMWAGIGAIVAGGLLLVLGSKKG